MAGVQQMMMGASNLRVAPALKGPPVGTTSDTGTSMVATIPANVAGDILILWVYELSLSALGAAPSVPGWNLLGSSGYPGGNPACSMWWRESTGSVLSATVTFTTSGTGRTTLGAVFDGNTVFKNPNPAMAITFGTPNTLDPPNQASLFTNNVWLAFLGVGVNITSYPAGMLGLVNYTGQAGSSACAALGSFTLTAYDPAPFGAGGTATGLPSTFVIVGKG